mmetsp:Transcript_52788/g.150467  ORF Transcript_52788/g.150467 Transcript_52788/m.150467 type:complete len:303 (-) Transcript_52788:319-1227(-)
MPVALLAACFLLGAHFCHGQDEVVLVQRSLSAQRAPQAEALERAEEILRLLGPLELKEKPTVADNEKLVMAEAMMKNPQLIQFYHKESAPATASSNAALFEDAEAHGQAEASEQSEEKESEHEEKESEEADASAASAGQTDALSDASDVEDQSVTALQTAATEQAAAAQPGANASKSSEEVTQATSSGACTPSDFQMMEAKGGGNARTSFPGLAAKCGKESYKIFGGGFDEKAFSSCLAAAVGLSNPCNRCFAGSALHGVKNCAMKCMMSWCSKDCLACNENYKRTELKQCVGGLAPAEAIC